MCCNEEAVIREALKTLAAGIPLTAAPYDFTRDPAVPHAPHKPLDVALPTAEDRRQALRNALRYFPEAMHAELAKEFARELAEYGHIYMYRFRPKHYAMRAYPVHLYTAKCKQAACIMMMIQNNLDPAVAQFPHELVTYGGNGSVFSNWAQYHLAMQYLSRMEDNQTMAMYSGHPAGLFPSHKDAPRVVVTNGMVIPNYSSKDQYERMYALGVSMYGQMTAGSYAYIGPQGIVHGTTLTLLNCSRKYLNTSQMGGTLYVTSGLGGMSGAQGKATRICGAVSIIAEVSLTAITKRHNQGWVDMVCHDVKDAVEQARRACAEKRSVAIAYHGNVVTLWEYLANDSSLTPDLASDQTSLHNPYNGGYYPVQISFEEANEMMASHPAEFKELVHESLRRHVKAINTLSGRGMRFWDYGNSFLLQSSRAGADVFREDKKTFRYPSYVQDVMGDIFSLGFGPFRWVCTSCLPADLDMTDDIAAKIIKKLADESQDESLKQQYEDNYLWITNAKENKLVVGSQARILYSDAVGRTAIAEAFNAAVREGRLHAPVVISRDHHDVSGTDSPFRETSNVYDGSSFCADMAVQNFVGDAFRGATWVSLHNGGGVGWGEVINGGFGMVLDGDEQTGHRARAMLSWDVNNGVARRSWAGNKNAEATIGRAMQANPQLTVTMPSHAPDDVIEAVLSVLPPVAAKQ
eukprot:TRINITY_DN18485_c0_g1_i1.p1 TRINITY_DN18485_c0_g1~~TRINITY_DN18485_c0_g1_i1.p1  ORF type:complete len:691 (-),score=213.46 TRINITY_DN18485_c0_g1_i1:60-2132(-)